MSNREATRTCLICGAEQVEDEMKMVGQGAPVAADWVCRDIGCLERYVEHLEHEIDVGLHQDALTIDQYARSRGVARGTARRWIDEGGLPFFKVGRVIRIRRDDAETWERKHTRVASVA